MWVSLSDLVEKTLSDSINFGAEDLEIFFMLFDSSSLPLIWTVKVFYQARSWPRWISRLMIWAFQTGHDSYLGVLAVCNQISKPFWHFPFPDVTNAFSDLFQCFCAFQFYIALLYFPIPFCSVGSPGQSQGFWDTSQTSDFSIDLLRFDSGLFKMVGKSEPTWYFTLASARTGKD